MRADEVIPGVRFWEQKALEAMSATEWEQLCDHCGLCCLVRIEDADSGVVYDTNVICRHYDCDNVRCNNYAGRESVAHGCEALTPATVREYDWLPNSCAYRVVMRGEPLPETHPLMGGTVDYSVVAQTFFGIGLVQDADDVDPTCHLIATDAIS
ncbi:MAG: YcgN family cysteine cluster protein [Gammaproteobacteria bacterium]|nr:YcgN family cysteine cluster protein [Gammaproteobacteria bacterium]